VEAGWTENHIQILVWFLASSASAENSGSCARGGVRASLVIKSAVGHQHSVIFLRRFPSLSIISYIAPDRQ